MAKNDNTKKIEFHDEMFKIRVQADKGSSNNESRGNQEVLNRVKTVIRPILKKFIKEDSLLTLQSSGPNDFYISYANAKLLKIYIRASETGEIRLSFVSTRKFSDVSLTTFSEEEICTAVQRALLDWYNDLFSSLS